MRPAQRMIVGICLFVLYAPSIAVAKSHTWRITTGSRAPDGYNRSVILVEGVFEYPLEVAQGEQVKITVINQMPKTWPSASNNAGVALHWHGLSMRNSQYADGVAFISQCPLEIGSSYTYTFTVNDPPGTYWWHDHATLSRADGLRGPLIVKPPLGTPELPVMSNVDDDVTLFLADHWHFTGDSMGLRLNRPFDPLQVTNYTGSWFWIGVPKSILINGKGCYWDCEDVYTRAVNKTMANGQLAQPKDLMQPSPAFAGQLGGPAAFPVCNISSWTGPNGTCQREEVVVQPGKTYRLRLTNAATLVYMTV